MKRAFVIACVAVLSVGCSALRSSAVAKLSEAEVRNLGELRDQIAAERGAVEASIADLELAADLALQNIEAWNAEVEATASGDGAKDAAVVFAMASRSIAETNSSAEVRADVRKRGEALLAAYDNLIAGVDAMLAQSKEIRDYADAGFLEYWARSLDARAVHAAASEFEQGREWLGDAAKLGHRIDDAIDKIEGSHLPIDTGGVLGPFGILSQKLREIGENGEEE